MRLKSIIRQKRTESHSALNVPDAMVEYRPSPPLMGHPADIRRLEISEGWLFVVLERWFNLFVPHESPVQWDGALWPT